MMQDYFGNDLWVGDTVALVLARFRNIQSGVIVKFNGNKVLVLTESSTEPVQKLPYHLVKFVKE